MFSVLETAMWERSLLGLATYRTGRRTSSSSALWPPYFPGRKWAEWKMQFMIKNIFSYFFRVARASGDGECFSCRCPNMILALNRALSLLRSFAPQDMLLSVQQNIPWFPRPLATVQLPEQSRRWSCLLKVMGCLPVNACTWHKRMGLSFLPLVMDWISLICIRLLLVGTL